MALLYTPSYPVDDRDGDHCMVHNLEPCVQVSKILNTNLFLLAKKP